MTKRSELESQLASVVHELNDLELEVVVLQATRLAKGSRTYQKLTEKRVRSHDWMREAMEEHLDRGNYDTLAHMQLMYDLGLRK